MELDEVAEMVAEHPDRWEFDPTRPGDDELCATDPAWWH
jgi:hypothetical protein